MAEYIEREAALMKLMQGGCSAKNLQSILDMPAADVAPVTHGRWISKNHHGYEWIFVCSNCGYVDGYPFNDRLNYCPNCFAKMDETVEENKE